MSEKLIKKIAEETKKEETINIEEMGLDVEAMQKAYEEEQAAKKAAEEASKNSSKTVRSIKGNRNAILEIAKNVFLPLGLDTDTGLINITEAEEGKAILKWDTAKLSLIEDPDLAAAETYENIKIIECLLFGRHERKLLLGMTDEMGNPFPVYPKDSVIIQSSFETITTEDKVEEVLKIFRKALNVAEINTKRYIHKFYTPAIADNQLMMKVSLLVINRTPKEIDILSKAMDNNKTIKTVSNKTNDTLRVVNATTEAAANFAGDVIKGGSEIAFTATGIVANAAANGVVSGVNEFRKHLNIGQIKESTAFKDLVYSLTKGKKKGGRSIEY